MVVSDKELSGLPSVTRSCVERFCGFGFNRNQVHGLFVLLGLDTGTPRVEEELKVVINNIQPIIPTFRDINIDEQVGDFYNGYESKINEYWLKTGLKFDFRPIKASDDMDPVYIVKPWDDGVLDSSVKKVNKLIDSTRLYRSFLEALGEDTAGNGRTLVESFLCGVFQMQLFTVSDHKGAAFLSGALVKLQPLTLGTFTQMISRNQIDNLLSLLNLQIPLSFLIGGIEASESEIGREFIKQIWAFQSHLFYQEGGVRTYGKEELDIKAWYEYVLKTGRAFDSQYPTQLLPLSAAGVTLPPVPSWASEINNFSAVDEFIFEVWGFEDTKLLNYVEMIEYKALLIYTVYASLTESSKAVGGQSVNEDNSQNDEFSEQPIAQQNEKIALYADRAKKYGISEEELQFAGNTVAGFGIEQRLVDFFLEHEYGPLLVYFLSQNVTWFDRLQKLGFEEVCITIEEQVLPAALEFQNGNPN